MAKFAAVVVDTGGKFAAGVVDTGGNNTGETGGKNLTPVSCDIGGKLAFEVFDTGGKFAACVIDTSGKFAAGVVDTSGKFATGVVGTYGAPWLANILANFRKKIWNGPNEILWGWGETESRKKPEAKKYPFKKKY